MPFKISMLMDFSSSPTNRAVASIHSGGWSESFWFNGSAGAIPGFMPGLMNVRSRFLPASASVVGWRAQNYTIAGNKLLPGGSISAHQEFPGNPNLTADLPQAALELVGTVNGAPNVSRSMLRGMPDEAISGGEYNGSQPTIGNISNYTQALLNVPVGYVGRNLSLPSSTVVKVLAGVVTLIANVGGVAGTDFLRFVRCRDENGTPIEGSYLITAIAGNVYTLANFGTPILNAPSGTARIDALAYYTIAAYNTGRAAVKKIGRPFEQYRGRRSRVRA